MKTISLLQCMRNIRNENLSFYRKGRYLKFANASVLPFYPRTRNKEKYIHVIKVLRKTMKDMGFNSGVIRRICWLILGKAVLVRV